MPGVTIAIAGIRITVWTEHSSDIECLKEVLSYHINNDEVPYDNEKQHDVIITSSRNRVKPPANMPLIWEGDVHGAIPVKWYNCVGEKENVIIVADDILIRHLPERNLTVCCLSETKARFFKSCRPLLSNYMFFLLQSITSMYGKYCIHASCLVRENQGYLFTGQSGSGKTTISEILGKAGWKYMGDDLVFISQNENDEIVVDSFLSKAKIFNAKQTKKNTVDMIEKWNFNYACREKLGYIIKLQRTGATKKSTLIPAPQTEIFTWLVYAGNNIQIQYRQQQWMDLCEKASSVPAYTLLFADRQYFNPAILDAVSQ
jgi:energy-coupling factor transporter ATP-binding protein EcfA2